MVEVRGGVWKNFAIFARTSKVKRQGRVLSQPRANRGPRRVFLNSLGWSSPGYPLEQIEDPKAEVSFRVERMKLSKDKTELRYNDFLLLRGIPAAAFDCRLGNRSALEWVIDQYRVSPTRVQASSTTPTAKTTRSTSSASLVRSSPSPSEHRRSSVDCRPSICRRSFMSGLQPSDL